MTALTSTNSPAPAAPRALASEPPPRASHGLAHNALEAFGIFTSYALVVLLTWRCVEAMLVEYEYGHARNGNIRAGVLIAAALVGYVFADFMSGMVHWLFDRFFSRTTFFLGANFVVPFREHHSDPIDITRHGFLETNGNNCLATVIPLSILAFGPWNYENPVHLFGVAMITVSAVATFATNQFHKWAHTANPPAYVAWLQRKHIILPVDHHQIHHTWPYETHYCITTGWLNAGLRAIGYWAFLERIIESTGVKAHRDPSPVYPEPAHPFVLPGGGLAQSADRAAE